MRNVFKLSFSVNLLVVSNLIFNEKGVRISAEFILCPRESRSHEFEIEHIEI